jgi:hypothetical protein
MKTISYSLLFLITVVFSIILGYSASDIIDSSIDSFIQEDNIILENCNNLSLEETAKCLNNYVKTIYKYKKTDDKKEITLEELKQNGGDCLNWAKLYISLIDDLEFYSSLQIIDIDETTAHAYAVISDNTGYCILEQKNMECFSSGSKQFY